MSKHYSLKVSSFAFRCFAFCLFLLTTGGSIYSQGLACNAGVNVSMDTNCEAIIDATYILKGEPTSASPLDYTVIILNMDGSTPDSSLIMSSSALSGPYVLSNRGQYIKFDQPGKYKVSIIRNGDEITCWGDLLVEDKLLPFTLECACPESADVVPELCKFSCAMVSDFMDTDSLARIRGVNPIFRDNCGDLGSIEFDDELVRDTICGNWLVIRTWRTLVKDAKGNLEYKNLGCTQKFLFEGVGIDAVFPPNKKIVVECGINTSPQSLRNYFSNTSLFPTATPDSGIIASYPFLRDTLAGDTILISEVGLGLTPGSQDDLCKLTATHTDMNPIPICGEIGFKFVRRWDVLDWCDNQTREFFQVIKVMDTTDPTFEIPDTIPAGMTDPWTCQGDIIVPAPDTLADNCSTGSQITWLAYVLEGTNRIEANAANGYTLTGLTPGTYNVIYVAEDLCGNDAIKQSLLIIRDEVKPVALSKHEIKITFTEYNGECSSKVFPESIDAGSFDACSTINLSIRRKGEGTYGPFVKFTQDDITDVNPAGVAFGIVNVEMRVIDAEGNFNITWTRVRLEDKNARIETICGDTFIPLDCDDDLAAAIESAKPTAIIRACEDRDLTVIAMERSSTIDNRCKVGTVVVDYKIEGSVDTICTKTFSLGDIDSIGIVWPQPEIEVACTQTSYGDVTLSNETCNLLQVSEEIQPFDIDGQSSYCRKLVRDITVIDWCTYLPNQGDTIGIYRFRQVIKVKDNTVPVVTCEDITLTAETNCQVSGFQLVARATDAGTCADAALTYAAAIDTDGDGIYDLALSPVASEDGEVMAVVGTPLSVGTYKVRWRAIDECGNIGESICMIMIGDLKPPTPQCITTISTAVMNTSGTVGIWAKDFDLNSNSVDDCGGEVTYSFSGTDRNVPNMDFSCADIPNGISETVSFRVYVWDESGNVDFCTVMLRIDDNSDVCLDVNEGMAAIGGHITTKSGDKLESAEVYVKSTVSQTTDMKVTDIDGEYAFANNPLMNKYEIHASKNDDYLNGLSTLDIILIQRHILALATLGDPLQVVAADVNGDERVTALDLVEMRRVLLGVSDEFTSGASWKFIAKDQTFDNPLNPWPLQEALQINQLDQHMIDQDFLAIKLGDVNGNAIANSAILGGGRSHDQYPILVEDRTVNAGDDVTVTLDISALQSVYGYQMAINLKDGSWKATTASHEQLTGDHQSIEGSRMMISWSETTPQQDGGMVTLRFTAGRKAKLSELLKLDATYLQSEIYTGDDVAVTTLDLAWSTSSSIDDAFEVYQNVPNPWGLETTVGFKIDNRGKVELAVFDVTGRQIMGTSAVFDAGYNEFRLSQSDLNESGVLYYQLTYDNQVATRKMIAIE